MQTKAVWFIMFLVSQMIVLGIYQFDAVDKFSNTISKYGIKDRWNSSSGKLYEYVFSKKKNKENDNSNSPDNTGFFASLVGHLSNVKKTGKDWIDSHLWKKSVVYLPPPSFINKGDIKNHAFAPKITESVYLLVLITSHAKAYSRRNVIRQTWAGTIESRQKTGKAAKSTNTNSAFKTYCVFTVGFSNDANLDQQIESEFSTFGDVLRVDKRESYKNLVHKIWGSFGWAFTVKPKFILKADDDVYVNLPHFIGWLHDSSLPVKLYAGFIHYRAHIYRNPESKWFVSRSSFPGQYFPNYCAGPFYVFSGNVLKQLYQSSQKVKKFQVEDAYFGVVAKRIGLNPYHAGKGFLLDNNLQFTVSKIPDSRFKELSVIGHGIDSPAIELIYSRYQKINQKNKNS